MIRHISTPLVLPSLALGCCQFQIHISASPCPKKSLSFRFVYGLAVTYSLNRLVVCGHIIDFYGDHVLGCGHGPLRIKRHNALCDIIWHSLLLDNKGAIKEQRCGESNNRPGDVFHPDFKFGKPAYFDVSVRGSLQPQHLSKAADHPGTAGEAGCGILMFNIHVFSDHAQ